MQINVPTLNIFIYYYLFIYLFNFRFLLDVTKNVYVLDVTNSHFFGYLFMFTHTKNQTNKQKQCKNTHTSRFEPLTPRWQINKNEYVTDWTTTSCVTLSDFINYIKFYIIMLVSHEFTIFVFSIYWKGTEKLSAIHTQSLITRSCYIYAIYSYIFFSLQYIPSSRRPLWPLQILINEYVNIIKYLCNF
jgi:hypothetical protein